MSGECHGHRILIPLASSVMGPEYTEEIQFFNVLLSIFFFLYTALRFMVEILNYTASQGNRKNDSEVQEVLNEGKDTEAKLKGSEQYRYVFMFAPSFVAS